MVELIVIMAVIAVLVLLAIPKLMGHTQKAKLTEIKSNIKQSENASERYYIDHNEWPRDGDVPYTAEELESFCEEIQKYIYRLYYYSRRCKKNNSWCRP